MDAGVDSDSEGSWLSYGELAAIRGIDRTSALKLALRHRWRKQRDNRGTVRVCVPLEWAAPADKRAASGADIGTVPAVDMSADINRIVSGFEVALGALREQLTAASQTTAEERARADRAEAALGAERARAEQAKVADRASLRAEHDRLMAVVEARLAEANGRADRAEQAIVAERNALRADHERVMAAAAARVAEAADRADRAEQALVGERSRGETLRDRLEAAERAAEAAAAEAEQASRKAEEAGHTADTLRDGLDVAEARGEAAQRDARTVQEATEALRQAETTRQAKGLLARLRAAWRGE